MPCAKALKRVEPKLVACEDRKKNKNKPVAGVMKESARLKKDRGRPQKAWTHLKWGIYILRTPLNCRVETLGPGKPLVQLEDYCFHCDRRAWWTELRW